MSALEFEQDGRIYESSSFVDQDNTDRLTENHRPSPLSFPQDRLEHIDRSLKQLEEALRGGVDSCDENSRIRRQGDRESEGAEGVKATDQLTSYIWGTLVTTKDVFKAFCGFIKGFCKMDRQPYYLQRIEQAVRTESTFLDLDCDHLRQFDLRLHSNLLCYPQELIPIMDMVISHIGNAFVADPLSEECHLQVRPFHLDKTCSICELDPMNIDQLISVRGMVIRSSQIIPDIRRAFFECSECSNQLWRDIERGRISEPIRCSICKGRLTFSLIHNRSLFEDKQIIRLQELSEVIPDGSTPQSVQLIVHDTLVDYVCPGDKVLLTGIYRATPARQSASQRSIKHIYKTYIDVLHFQKIGRRNGELEAASQSMSGELPISALQTLSSFNSPLSEKIGDAANLSDCDGADLLPHEQEFIRVSRREDIYQLLVKSFAPNIWMMEDVKKGILCQLFGGTNKNFAEASTGKFRSEINILLCGDPGTSKSQLLQYAHNLAPRGIFSSGKGSSAVGLTAYITKDPDTHEAVLESGALTLSDGGLCCIDEFDKMSDSTRSVLHEAMEQQTVSVAKCGIVATLNARTSILASANPRESRYNKRLSVVENIQLPPTILSRFDLIYLILDQPDREQDTKLAKHIVSLYFEKHINASRERCQTDAHTNDIAVTAAADQSPAVSSLPILPFKFLCRYIRYAKLVSQPLLSDEASESLVKAYVDMRSEYASHHHITATTRQLESLIRISESLARMRLAQTVVKEDVLEAVRLMRVATYRAAIDPTTGRLDMDLLFTGHGASYEKKIKELMVSLIELIRSYPADSIPEENLFATLLQVKSHQSISHKDFLDALHLLQEDSLIVISGGSGRHKVIRRL